MVNFLANAIFARTRPLGLLSKAALAFLLLLPALPAAAQPGSLSVGFGGGLHDADNALTIGDNEAQDALNVRLTKDGVGIKSRQGIAINASLTVGTAPVVGAHYFRTAGGTTVRLVAHDRNVAASADGAAFSNIITTAPTNVSYWDFADSQGSVWGLSSVNTELFSYNGSAVTWYPSLPKGTQVEATPDRLIISGTSANPNRVNYSAQGSFTNFTAGNDPNSPFTDDIGIAGDKITAIKYALGRLIYWTSGGMGACEGTDQFNMVCYDVSKTVGTFEPMSVVYTNGAVYFRAQDNHFYSYDGQALTKLTREQGVWVSQLLGTTGRTDVMTSQGDWNTGAQNAYATWNTTSTAGSIYPSTWGVTATSQAEFLAGTNVNFSTAVSSGSLYFQYLTDNFSDGDATASSSWTIRALGSPSVCNYAVASGTMTLSLTAASSGRSYCTAFTTATATYGTWSWDWLESGIGAADYHQVVWFVATPNGEKYGVRLWPSGASQSATLVYSSLPNAEGCGEGCTVIGGPTTAFSTTGWWHSYKVNRSTTGAFTVYRDGTSIITGTNTSITDDGATFRVALSGISSLALAIAVDNIVTPTTATFTSVEYDTTSTTPTWGNLEVSSAIPSGTPTLTLQASVAATSGGAKDAGVTVTNGNKITSGQKRYVTFIASATASATDTPITISSFTLAAATTGQFHAPCISGNSVVSIGVLSCAVTTGGNGAATLYGRSGASCPLSSSWAATTNNANFVAAANEAFQWRVDSVLTHSTDTVVVDQCNLSYVEGGVGATFGQVYDGDIYWSVVYSSGLKQNRVLYYDLTHGAMFPWDLRVSAMVDAGNTLYMGCSDCGKLYQFGGVDNDTGTAISSHYITKEFALGDISRNKALDAMTLILKKQGSGSMSLDYTVDGTTTTTKTVGMTSSRPIIVSNFNASNTANGKVVRFKFYNTTINVPWETYGLNLTYHFLPWGPN